MAQSSRAIYWSAILADFRRSGMTHVQFCSVRRISIHSFRSWLYRLRPGLPPRRPRSSHTSTPTPPPPANDPPPFLPVHVRDRARAATTADIPHIDPPSSSLELVLDKRHLLRIPSDFDPATLHRLLDALEERP